MKSNPMSKKQRIEAIDRLLLLRDDEETSVGCFFDAAVKIIAQQELRIKDLTNALAKSNRKRIALSEMIEHSANQSAKLRGRISVLKQEYSELVLNRAGREIQRRLAEKQAKPKS